MSEDVKKRVNRLEYSADMLKSLRNLIANDASDTVLLHLRAATELTEREAFVLSLQVRETKGEDA